MDTSHFHGNCYNGRSSSNSIVGAHIDNTRYKEVIQMVDNMEKLIFAGVAIILFLAAAVMIFMIGNHVLSTEQRQRVTIIERGLVTSSNPIHELLLEFEDGARKIVRTDEDT